MPELHTPDAMTGRYTLVARLPDGNTSELYRARVEGACGFERFILIKRLSPERALSEPRRRRFIRQATICSKLTHHNIVGVYDFYQEESGLYLAMEFIRGTSLDQLLDHCRSRNQALPPPVVVTLLLQVLDAIDYLHRAIDPASHRPFNLVHRDLKPRHLLIDRAGLVKLTGFGRCQFASGTDDDPLEEGISAYAAPELVDDMRVTRAADIFALGSILFEMLTLYPFWRGLLEPGETAARAYLGIKEQLQRLPPGLEPFAPILKRACDLEPRNRYASAADFALALRSIPLKLHAHGDGEAFLRGLIEKLLEAPPPLPSPRRDDETTDGVGSLARRMPLPGSLLYGPPVTADGAQMLPEDGTLDELDEFDDDDFDELELEEDNGRTAVRRSRTVNLAAETWAGSNDSEKSLKPYSPPAPAAAPAPVVSTPAAAASRDGAPARATNGQSDGLGNGHVHEEPSVRLRFTPDQLQEAYDRLVTQRRETESYVLEVQDAAHLRPESLLHTDGAYDDVTDPVMLRRPAPEEAARAIETQLYTRSGLALLCIRPSPGLRCHIPASGLSVGRSHRNDLVLPDVELSDFHAMVIWEAGQWWIRCSRGESLKVNGEQQREAELVPGAQLELGDACFLVMADRSDPPGMMLDYPALLEELVERFPDILQEGTFRLNAGLRVEERVLLLPPRRRWNEVLNALRSQADVRPLRRLISALEQLQPEARMVQRARRCLDGLAGLEARAVS